MLFHGISIADPGNKNIKHNQQKINNELENSQVQNKSMPHFVISDQDQHNNFVYFKYPSDKGFDTIKEDTVPITTTLEYQLEDKHYAFRNEKKADVEIPILETGKNLSDMNGEGYFDPGIKEKINYSQLKPGSKVFNSTIKFNRPITDKPTFMANPNNYAKEKNYLYNATNRSYQPRFYSSSPWLDSVTGRASLFEAPREVTRLA